nr:aspartate dehydrogenase [uncultured Merdimonas sp.]
MFRGKKKNTSTYNSATHIPAIRCSICTGEQVAGFQEMATGKFTDICLIRDERDLKAFRDEYGISENQEIKKIY